MKVAEEARICFGIEWYDSEAEADERSKEVAAEGRKYNGGYFDGMSCGRETRFDMIDEKTGKKLFAVTM